MFGTLAETYRRCGRAGCHCADGPKHGPHLSLSFQGPGARTHAFYVPQALQAKVRAGVAAWHEVQQVVRALGDLHRQQLWAVRDPARVSASGGAMIQRAYQQRSLVEVLLPDGDKLWDDELQTIDAVLDDEVIVDRVAEALRGRRSSP